MPDVPIILEGLPYFNLRSSVIVRGQVEPVKPTQIIIWASITSMDQAGFDPATPRLPVVLDTGLSHNFAIREELLSRWAGIDIRYLGVAVHESRVTSVQIASSREVAPRMRRSIRPTRARRPSDASVDPTEARKAAQSDITIASMAAFR